MRILCIKSAWRIFAGIAVLCTTGGLEAQSSEQGRVFFPNSVKTVAASIASAERAQSVVSRTSLTAAQAEAPMEFEVALRMRRFSEFEGRIQRGERIPFQELSDKYLPTQEDSDRISAWMTDQGLTVVSRDPHRLGIFVRGSVAQVASALGVDFASVAAEEGESTVAVSPPSVPSQLAPAILCFNGLQPHQSRRQQAIPDERQTSPGALSVSVSGYTYSQPSDIAAAYKASGTGFDGTGQTIAIIIDSIPDPFDLTTFWNDCGVGQSLSHFSAISVAGGPTPNGHELEASLDVEWTSSIAPGSKIRLYAIPGIVSLDQLDQAFIQIINDLPGNPGMNQVSISIGLPEDWYTPAQLQSSSQYLAILASQGVTVFAGSGDGGSNPDLTFPEAYNPKDPVAVSYPGSDPYVIGVGGTNLVLTATNSIQSETVWGLTSGATYPSASSYDATGGGYSIFARPLWQSGLVLPPGPSGTGRCVPDVAGPALGTPPALVIYNHGQSIGIRGTSWSTPIWAGFCALINQARSASGEPPVGNLAPKLYALSTGTVFRPISSGTNGAYAAADGYSYNLCTGLGPPNVEPLLTALVKAPTIESEPADQTVGRGSNVTLGVTASGAASLSYQWLLNGSPIPGATQSTLVLSNVETQQAGRYTATITNSYGSVTSLPAMLTVTGDARLVNISTRALVMTSGNILVSGLVITGGGSKQILVRGIGPTLTKFGVGGALARPQLTLFNNAGNPIASDTAWGGGQALGAMFAQLGAFALDANSADSALLMNLSSGLYTVQVAGVGGTTGVALAEIYDADSGSPAARLANFSSRGFVGTGGNALVAGFVIAGTTSETVLIRGVGPALSQFGVNGVLAAPHLTLFNSAGSVIATNSGWGGGNALADTFTQVGAFGLPANSADCAIMMTLPPGLYTAEVDGLNSTTGVALVEVYDVP